MRPISYVIILRNKFKTDLFASKLKRKIGIYCYYDNPSAKFWVIVSGFSGDSK